jgi:hypothetical protein
MPDTLPVATGKVYGTQDEALQALLPGWHVTGSKVVTRKVPNTNRTTTSDPAEIDQPYGRELTVANADGTLKDSIVVNDVQNPSAKGGAGVSVLQGPTKNQPQGSQTNKPSDPAKWQPVTRPGTTDVVGTWDPVNNEFHAVAAPPGAQPTGKYDPVTVTDPDGTQRQVGMVDTGDKSFHPLAAPPDAKPSGKYDNQYVTNADGTRRLVGMVDTGDKHFIPVSADPTTQKKTIQTPNAVYSVDDNDNVNKLFDIDKSVPLQAVVIDGTAYSFDPNEKDPTKRLVQVSQQNLPQQIKQGDVTYVLQKNDDGTFQYKLPPGVDKPAAVQTNTTAKTLDWYDANGNLIKSVPNQNYVEPKVDQPNLPPTNLVAPNILVPDPDKPGSFKWIPNEARVTASEALQNLASSLSGHVVDGKISVDEAKTIIDGANTAMTTARGAASDILQATAQGAQTGASLINQRVQAASSMLNNTLGLAAGAKNLMTAPAGLGEALTQGIAGWTADLAGGQATLDSAARLVQQADPRSNLADPTTQHAIGVLSQMLDKYQELNGAPHPAVAATQAARQSAQTGGLVAPATAPGGYNPSDIQWNQPPNVANVPGRTNVGLGMGTAPAPAPAPFVAPAGPPPGANYGANVAYTGGVAPWNAQPGPAIPSFVAPPTQPNRAPVTITVG